MCNKFQTGPKEHHGSGFEQILWLKEMSALKKAYNNLAEKHSSNLIFPSFGFSTYFSVCTPIPFILMYHSQRMAPWK